MSITIKTKTRAFKKDFITLPLSDLDKYREETDGIHMHEVIGETMRPAFDLDKKCLTLAEFAGNDIILQAAKQEVDEQFPKAKHPRAKIISLVSSGPSTLVNEQKEDVQGWKISAHFIVTGVGSWPPAQVKEVASRFSALK
jgi:hypothetical protein